MTADEIVRRLAAADWVYDYICCFFCAAMAHIPDGEFEPVADEPHKDDCVYKMALDYVEAMTP